MVTPFYIKGLELVRISDLPANQSDFINRNIKSTKLINVFADEEIFKDCITYEEYERLMSVFSFTSYEQYFDSQF